MIENENSFVEDPELAELHIIESEIARIEQSLLQNISAEQTAEITREIFDIAVRINQINSQILADPSIEKNYFREGNLLRARNHPNSYTTLPSISYLLKSLKDGYLQKPKILLNWLNEKKQIAEDRLAMLQKTGDITFANQETIAHIKEIEKESENKEIEKYFDKLIKEEKDENGNDT